MPGTVGFATGKPGTKVGDGECTRLVEEALKKDGKKTTHDFGKTKKTDDYIWGLQISPEDARPGDIIQFRNHVLYVTVRKQDAEGEKETAHRRPHHTAII